MRHCGRRCRAWFIGVPGVFRQNLSTNSIVFFNEAVLSLIWDYILPNALTDSAATETKPTMTYESIAQRLAANSIDTPEGCRIWTGNVNNSGYARYSVRCCGQVRKLYAHRTSYELTHGPIPAGLELDHLCSNPRCVNPFHLEPVTGAENLRRRDARRAASVN